MIDKDGKPQDNHLDPISQAASEKADVIEYDGGVDGVKKLISCLVSVVILTHANQVLASGSQESAEGSIEWVLKQLGDMKGDILIPIIAAIVTSLIIGVRTKKSLDEKRFTDQLQMSMHFVKDGKLYIEKCFSETLDDLLKTRAGVAALIKKVSDRKIKKVLDSEEPLLEFKVPEHRKIIERTLRHIITQSLRGDNLVDLSEADEIEEIKFWAALTMENYQLKRNEIPRLIIVPYDQLDHRYSEEEIEAIKTDYPHQKFRLRTHNSMYDDINSAWGPQSCFEVVVRRPKRKGIG